MRINVDGITYILVQIVSESEQVDKLLGSSKIISYAYVYNLREKIITKIPADKLVGGKVE